MILTYSGRSAPSAQRIADEDDDIFTHRGSNGDINWGRARANTSLNLDISNSTNKRRMRELFRDNDVPMPRLYEGTDSLSNRPGINPLYRTVVGRPDTHSKGRGFWKCNSWEDIFRATRGTRRKKAATHFMEYIEADHELRVHIFKGKSIRISEKSFSVDNNGKRDYTTIKPTCEVKQARKAAKKAVEALGLDFGAVDILVMEDGTPYVLEVNAAPGVGGSMPKLYADTFTKWYKEQVLNNSEELS